MDLLAPFDDELNVESLEPGFVSADFGVHTVTMIGNRLLPQIRTTFWRSRGPWLTAQRSSLENAPSRSCPLARNRRSLRHEKSHGFSKVNLTEVQKLQIEERALGGAANQRHS